MRADRETNSRPEHSRSGLYYVLVDTCWSMRPWWSRACDQRVLVEVAVAVEPPIRVRVFVPEPVAVPVPLSVFVNVPKSVFVPVPDSVSVNVARLVHVPVNVIVNVRMSVPVPVSVSVFVNVGQLPLEAVTHPACTVTLPLASRVVAMSG